MLQACSRSLMAGTVLVLSACATQTPPPAMPAERQLARWIETFNTGERDGWQEFIAEHFPEAPDRTVDQNLALRQQTGGFELVTIEESTPTRAVALLREGDAEATAARVILDVESSEPHRIVAMALEPGVRLPVSIARLSAAALVTALQSELEARVADDRFSGAVLVAQGGDRLFAGAYGLADRERGVANTLDTRFRNGSMNKMFTAAAVLTLAQAGRIALDAPLAKYLPEYPNEKLASAVTVHHLLTHTGGTGDVFGPEFVARRLALRTHQDYIDLYGSRDLLFDPGSQWMYSNYGFILLGALIERVSGQSYYDYVREHVYEPAGMTSTGSEPEEATAANRAIGYMRGPAGLQPNTGTLPYRGTAAGGGYTTVQDLQRFANALMNRELLNDSYTDLLTTGKVEAPGGRYAYGFFDRVVNGVRTIGHGGNAPGMDGDLVILADSDYLVAVLANRDAPAAQRISEFIAIRLPER